MTIHGADAAASFGLDAPEATAPRFYTSARTHAVRIDGEVVRFEHVPGIHLAHPGTPAGTALAALRHLGAAPTPEDVAAIVDALPSDELRRLREVRMRLPDRVVSAWLAADPEALLTLPAPIDPVGAPRETIARSEPIRLWREENPRMAARFPRVRAAKAELHGSPRGE